MSLLSRSRTTIGGLAVAGMLLAACGGSEEPAAAPDAMADDGAMDDADHSGDAMDDADSGDAMGDDADAMGDGDAMAEGDFDHPVLTSVAIRPDGSKVSIADFAGKTVFVETFATWCSTCRRQLQATNEAAGQTGDDVVFLILSVEGENFDASSLAEYADDNGFDNIEFALLDNAGLQAFNEQFGRTVLNAPSTPKFVVQADGTIGEMQTGPESVDEILAQVA